MTSTVGSEKSGRGETPAQGGDGEGEDALTDQARAEWITSLDARLATKSLGGHWQHREPARRVESLLWRWSDIYEGLLESGEAVRLGPDTNRRTIQLRNPALASGTSKTIQMSIQLVRAGERARAHRHTMQAIRFVVEGGGAYTVVEGERFVMEPNDLILTPGWTWHDHANPTLAPTVWLDGLDAPLTAHLDAQFQVDFPEEAQTVTKPDGTSTMTLGSSRPPRAAADLPEFPPYRYAWSDTRPALERLAERTAPVDDDPFDAVLLEYVNPLTGGHTLPTMGCRVQMLRPGQATRSHRHTGTTIYHSIEGSGRAVVDGQRLEWGPRDCFIVPPWRSHHFVNASTSDPTILFSMTDTPVLEALRLYREEETPVDGAS